MPPKKYTDETPAQTAARLKRNAAARARYAANRVKQTTGPAPTEPSKAVEKLKEMRAEKPEFVAKEEKVTGKNPKTAPPAPPEPEPRKERKKTVAKPKGGFPVITKEAVKKAKLKKLTKAEEEAKARRDAEEAEAKARREAADVEARKAEAETRARLLTAKKKAEESPPPSSPEPEPAPRLLVELPKPEPKPEMPRAPGIADEVVVPKKLSKEEKKEAEREARLEQFKLNWARRELGILPRTKGVEDELAAELKRLKLRPDVLWKPAPWKDEFVTRVRGTEWVPSKYLSQELTRAVGGVEGAQKIIREAEKAKLHTPAKFKPEQLEFGMREKALAEQQLGRVRAAISAAGGGAMLGLLSGFA